MITEFGRTAHINGTDGTDHGTATVALLAGGALKGGRVIADWPSVNEAALYEKRDLKATTDLRAVLIVWLRTPLTAVLMILLLIALFYHTALGLQVVIEDYVHSATKFAAVIAVRLGCSVLVTAGVVAVLRITFSG